MRQVPPSANALPPNVVVVNDDITQLNVLCGLLRKAGMTPVPFQSAETALAQMNPQQLPDLIVTDLYMPGIDGWRFCRLLRSSEYPAYNKIPILVASSIFSGDEPSRIASELGANAFLSMSAGGQVFIQRVQDLLKGRESGESLRALLVEPDQQLWESLLPSFQSQDYRVEMAATFREALKKIEESAYDVAVLDAHLPDGSADVLLNVLRQRIPGCVCLMITAVSRPERALEWMKLGAAAYLQKPFDAEYLVSQCNRARRERALLRIQDDLVERTRQLQQSESLFKDIFEKHAAVKLLVDPETGLILDANHAAEIFYGWSKDQLKNMRIQDINILSPEAVQQEMQRAALLKNIHFEFRHRLADGSIRDVAVFSSGIQVNDKTVLHSIIHDITEQKKAERALQDQLIYQQKILQTTHDGYWLLDVSGRFIEVNDAYCQMLGYSREELLNFKIADVNPWEDSNQTLERLQRIIIDGSEMFESRQRKKDGSILQVEVSVTYLDVHGGRYICFGRDISERKHFEEVMNGRLVALTRPLDQPEGIDFKDLFNLEAIQRLQDEFSAATGVASIITYPDGSPITRPSKFCRLCQYLIRGTELGQANCFRSDGALGSPSAVGPIIQPCLSGGLWDAGASITVGGRHIANWLIGQVRDDTQTEEKMRAYAIEIGADEADFIRAYHEVPMMSQTQFRLVAQVLFTLAQQLSATAYQNVQQARFITAQKQAETALRESEERFRKLSEDIPICVCSFLPDSTMTYVNSAQAALSGLTPDEMIGRKFFDLLDPEYRDLVEKSLAALTPEEPTEGHEQAHYHQSDSTTHYIEWRNRAFFDDQGKIVRLLGVGLDITERKRVEEALRLSEERYRNIFNNSAEGIFQATIEGQYQIVNPAYAHMFGYESAEEMISSVKNIGEQLYVHPQDRIELMNRLMASDGRVNNYELQLKRKDGSHFWVSINGFILCDKDNIPLILEGTCIDITARKDAEAKVLEQLDELRRWHNITLGRENRILELKNEVNELLAAAGKPLRYASVVAGIGSPPTLPGKPENQHPESDV